MTEILEWIKQGMTPGGVGIWVGVGSLLGMWWKGLPAVLDALANRQSKVEERMGKLLEDATMRFERQILAADQRHEECVKGQHDLIREVERLRTCVAEQQETIDGFRRKFSSLQTAALRQEGSVPSQLVEAAMASLDSLPPVAK